jgi:hypothetical protein
MILWIKAHIGWLSVLFILLIICTFLLYSWLDARITIEYVLQEQKDQLKEIEVLQSLLLETGKRMSRSEIEQLVAEHIGKEHMKK